MPWIGRIVVLLCASPSSALVVGTWAARPRAAPALPSRRTPQPLLQGFDTGAQQFDVLSLRTFRRDTILQYDATNQSEPLRIALTLLGVLFSLCIPTLFDSQDTLTTSVAAVAGTGISGTLFLRNRAARAARMAKIDLEYSMGALKVVYRGVRVEALSDLRDKRRVVAVVGSRAFVERAMLEARVYRRRLTEAGCIVVPVCTEGAQVGAAAGAGGEAESRWLYSLAGPEAWLDYFDELLGARGMALGGEGAWLGLTFKGRSFGSALGYPRWDELLGTALQPRGDGFGDLSEVASDAPSRAAEAAEATLAASGTRAGTEAAAAAAAEASQLLEAQQAFYEALTKGDVAALDALWRGAAADQSVSEALEQGARIEPWAAGSNAFPPAGMRATDRDGVIVGDDEAWTTAIERPAEGGTLLATQRWRRVDGEWLLATHRYIPWSAAGATAITTLRCDARGCVLLGREINTRDRRGAVL